MTELRQLASRCGFGASEEELIRDRLLAGCRVDRIHEKLLLEPDTLTLADALKIAQSVERALQESVQLGPHRKEQSSAEVGQLRRASHNNRTDRQRERSKSNQRSFKSRDASKGPSCGFCGGARHDREHCPAAGKTCSHCGKLNHFARVCRSAAKSTKSALSKSASHRNDDSDVANDSRVYTSRLSARPPRAWNELNVVSGNFELELQLDIGAEVSVLSMDAYRKLRPRPQPRPARPQLNNFDGSRIAIKRTLKIPVSFNGHTVEAHQFFVVQRGTSLLASICSAPSVFKSASHPSSLRSRRLRVHRAMIRSKSSLMRFRHWRTLPSCSTTTLTNP